jgi:hypothetical protein
MGAAVLLYEVVRPAFHAPTLRRQIWFVSYRRDDAASEAGRLTDALGLQLGNEAVFMDTSSIAGGTRWPDALRAELKKARTVVLVI